MDRLMLNSRKGIRAWILLVMLVTIFLFQMTSYGEDNASVEERLADAVVVYVNSPFALVNNEERQIHVENTQIAPFVEKGRTLVPIRFVSEALGAQVSWDSKESTVYISSQNKTIKITIGSNEMYVNDKKIVLDVPAMLTNNTTFVPLRAVSEALDKEVFYDRGLIIISDSKDIFNIDTEKTLLDAIITRVNQLPSVGTRENLIEILSGIQNTYPVYRDMIMVTNAEKSMAADEATSDAGTDYSLTNLQVQGVDEADIIKTDGSYIYQVTNQKVVISKAFPVDAMKVSRTIAFEDESFTPQELYVDEKHLVVIGSAYDYYTPKEVQSSAKKVAIYPSPYRPNNRVKAYIYDINNKKNIEMIREVELEGNYVSSRKIESSLYMIANSGINYYIMNEEEDGPIVPYYRDSAVQDEYIQVPYKDIKCMPPVVQPSYLVVGTLNLDSADAVHIDTYLGASDNIYASSNNLYIAVSMRHWGPVPFMEPVAEEDLVIKENEPKTLLYKFSMDKDKTTYLAKGEVPGNILNQFSMDEYNGYFRIATTRNTWKNGDHYSDNNVYILDESLNRAGELENIAPDERIYSVRFMGDRAYMVTFKNVDPLFVLDLKDPWQPTILGKLKIPGYSDYLHPYDENHIIGFGKDTIELPIKDWRGNDAGMSAYYLGMKIALFDVSDVNNPIEKYNVKIGDRGTDSELLSNHKALLFDKKRDLLAFPITVREVKGDLVDARTGIPKYGEITFQGAYVYNLTAEKGFDLEGKISHLKTEDYLKAGYYDVDRNKAIRRLLYIDDILYSVSDTIITAHDIESLDEVERLVVK